MAEVFCQWQTMDLTPMDPNFLLYTLNSHIWMANIQHLAGKFHELLSHLSHLLCYPNIVCLELYTALKHWMIWRKYQLMKKVTNQLQRYESGM